MNFDEYALGAYKKNSSPDSGNKFSFNQEKENKVESISSQIRRNAEGGHEPLIHRAIFEKINTKLDSFMAKKKADEKTRADSEMAAKTGVWFEEKKSVNSQDVKEAADVLISGGLIKVPEEESPEKKIQGDSLYRRVAKFLIIIGLDEAAKILPHLTEEQTEKIIPELASIRSVSPEESQEILKEFNSLLEKSREEGGVDTARAMLTKAYGSKKAEEVLNKSIGNIRQNPFDFLSDADGDRISLLIQGESIGVQALVLSQLEAKKAAAVINSMDKASKSQIILRLAKMESVSPDVLEQISKSLRQKMLTQNTENSENLDGRSVLAEILKRMSPDKETNILEGISESNPVLAMDLRDRLFTQDDIVNADDRFIQDKLHVMNESEIALLIHGKSEDFRNKILNNVSKNRKSVILTEESLMQVFLKSDVEKISSKFFSELRRAWENGQLRIKGRDDWQYVE
ncbi:FliG C-terminal domain-containing protein [Treponema sp.]|uniref:flagellar motor switch protein FliG n=1 Tax=Treponema sp. TaxID=166 RepID=UPI0025EFA01C|nr:FliG C-terminal domain-containing protein [Treponema sp.]MCR5219095.1 flagellar motor switch protein FliG [Treponema sp.]